MWGIAFVGTGGPDKVVPPELRASVFCIISIVAGILLVLLALGLAYAEQKKIENWVEVEATIVGTNVHVRDDTGPTGSGYYEAQLGVVYTYEFGGDIYKDSFRARETVSSLYKDRAKAKMLERAAREYPIGAPLTLYVNPANPEQSTHRFSFKGSYTSGIAGVVFVIIGLIVRKFRVGVKSVEHFLNRPFFLRRISKDYDQAIHQSFAHFELGQYERVIEDYNQATRLKPKDADAYNNRGTAHFELGQHERAIEDYNQAIHLKPKYAQFYFNRGLAYKDQSQKAEAIADFEKFTTLERDEELIEEARQQIEELSR